MIDIGSEVVSLLNPIAPTFYYYPEEFENFPMISYFDSNHSGDNYFDGKATTDDIEVTVDCWERQDPTTGELNEIHFVVDSAMRNAGYRRISYVPMFESDTKIFHHSFRFKKIKEEI